METFVSMKSSLVCVAPWVHVLPASGIWTVLAFTGTGPELRTRATISRPPTLWPAALSASGFSLLRQSDSDSTTRRVPFVFW